MRCTATVILLAATGLTLAGCSPGGEPKKETVTVTATPTPTAAPSLSQAETKRLCSVAVAEAAPEWEDWNYSVGEWHNDPRTPDVCLGLVDEVDPASGNRAFMDALIDGLEMADDPRADQ